MKKHPFLLAALLFSSFFALAQNDTFKIKVTPLCPDYFIHISWHIIDIGPFPANGMVVNTSNGVILVDAAWDTAQTRQLLQLIADNLHKKETLCVSTHAHADKIGGISMLK